MIEVFIYISWIESFRRREGIATRLIDAIKQDGYELIDAMPNGKKESLFFGKVGFVMTAINAESDLDEDGEIIPDAGLPVFAWYNPNFQ